MAISGAAVAYSVTGGLIVFSGIKGATIADTVKAVLAGNLKVTGSQPVQFGTTGSSASGSSSNAASGPASQNYLTVAKYLVSNGYTPVAAAGICGCVAGESAGDVEAMQSGSSGGGGLIQWTPISSYPGLVTGNPSADLDAQLPAIIAYNNAQGAGLVQMLNSFTDPVQAADFYSEHFERPAVKDSDVRASVAQSVYNDLMNSSATKASTGLVKS